MANDTLWRFRLLAAPVRRLGAHPIVKRDFRSARTRERTVTLLFDPEHNLEERILNEQFVT